MSGRIPVDSADARDLAELDCDPRCACQREHDALCRGGWLGDDTDGHPIPCLACRPHLARGRRACPNHPPSTGSETSA